MADLQQLINVLYAGGVTDGLRDEILRKIHEKQILGEAIVAEGLSPVADLLWKQAIEGYAEAIEVLADVNPEVEKDRFYRAQRDARQFRFMLTWIREAIAEGQQAKAELDAIEENEEKEEAFDDNRQSHYPDD